MRPCCPQHLVRISSRAVLTDVCVGSTLPLRVPGAPLQAVAETIKSTVMDGSGNPILAGTGISSHPDMVLELG